MGEILSLKDFLLILRKRGLIILIVTALSVITSIILTYYVITPTYQSSTLLLVNRSMDANNGNLSGESLSNSELINTYNVIITSPRILDQVVEELSLNETYRSLRERVNVESEGDSQVVSIKVIDSNPELAMKISNSIANIFQSEILVIMQMNVNNVSILSPAEIEDTPISPLPLFNIILGVVVGLMLSIALALLIEYFDNSIRNENEIERLLGLPLLGTVMVIHTKKDLNPNKENVPQYPLIEKEESETIGTTANE